MQLCCYFRYNFNTKWSSRGRSTLGERNIVREKNAKHLCAVLWKITAVSLRNSKIEMVERENNHGRMCQFTTSYTGGVFVVTSPFLMSLSRKSFIIVPSFRLTADLQMFKQMSCEELTSGVDDYVVARYYHSPAVRHFGLSYIFVCVVYFVHFIFIIFRLHYDVTTALASVSDVGTYVQHRRSDLLYY